MQAQLLGAGTTPPLRRMMILRAIRQEATGAEVSSLTSAARANSYLRDDCITEITSITLPGEQRGRSKSRTSSASAKAYSSSS